MSWNQKYEVCETLKMAIYVKMADFLLGLRVGSKRLFCATGSVLHVSKIWYMLMKVCPGAAV